MYRLVMISVVCECKRDQDHVTGVLKKSHLNKCPVSDTKARMLVPKLVKVSI
jgi:hypothetical protein